MTTFTSRSSLLTEALFGATGLSLEQAANATSRVLMDPVQEGVVEAFARLVDSIADAVKTNDESSLMEKADAALAVVSILVDHERPEARASVVHNFALLKRQSELA